MVVRALLLTLLLLLLPITSFSSINKHATVIKVTSIITVEPEVDDTWEMPVDLGEMLIIPDQFARRSAPPLPLLLFMGVAAVMCLSIPFRKSYEASISKV